MIRRPARKTRLTQPPVSIRSGVVLSLYLNAPSPHIFSGVLLSKRQKCLVLYYVDFSENRTRIIRKSTRVSDARYTSSCFYSP